MDKVKGVFEKEHGLSSASDLVDQSRLSRLEDKIESKWNDLRSSSPRSGSGRSSPMDLVQTLKDEPGTPTYDRVGSPMMMSYRPAGVEWDLLHDRVFEELMVEQME